MTIRAITVRPLWAWGIVYGGKGVDNRSRGALHWKHRGPVLIHAAKQWDPSLRGHLTLHEGDPGYPWAELTVPSDERRVESTQALAHDISAADPDALRALTACGAIIGRANLTDIHLDVGCCRPWGESLVLKRWQSAGGVYEGSCVHVVFEDREPIWPPIDCNGALGLWTPPPDVLGELASEPTVGSKHQMLQRARAMFAPDPPTGWPKPLIVL